MGHSGPVTCVTGMQHFSAVADKVTTVVSGAADCTLNVWVRGSLENKFDLLQSVSFGSGFVFGVDVFLLCGHLLCACGTDTGKVEVFVKHGNQVCD